MIRLILMRHGNTFEAGEAPVQIGARTDLSLTAHGRAQAEAMAQYLALEGIHPEAIYAGALKRQTESAAILAKYGQIPVYHEPALTEIDYGAWEGLGAEEIERRWPRESGLWAEGKWQAGIFGGSLSARMDALERWFSSLRQKGAHTALGVTSNGLLRLFRNEKVKTGHFCEIHLLQQGLTLQKWNVNPIVSPV